MATYLDGMGGGKHNSDDAIASFTPKKETKHKTTWQKCYDMESEIQYLGEESPGVHYFGIKRRESEGFWDVEEDECFILLHEGNIDFEGYSSYPSIEERDVMYKILKEKNIL